MTTTALKQEIDTRNAVSFALLCYDNFMLRRARDAESPPPIEGKCKVCGVTVSGFYCRAHADFHPQFKSNTEA